MSFYLGGCLYLYTKIQLNANGDEWDGQSSGSNKYRMRSNCSRTKLSRMEDFTIFAVFIFADAHVPNIILHIYAIYVI